MEQRSGAAHHESAEEVIALLRSDLVFELTHLKREGVWRAFYRTAKHHDPAKGTYLTEYSHADGATPAEAIINAAAEAVARKLK